MEIAVVVLIAFCAFLVILGVDFIFNLFSAFAPFLLLLFLGAGVLIGYWEAIYNTILAFFKVYLKKGV